MANIAHIKPVLPHEHDEQPETATARKGVVVQAAKDVATGLVDTDNYTRVSEDNKRAATRAPRRR